MTGGGRCGGRRAAGEGRGRARGGSWPEGEGMTIMTVHPVVPVHKVHVHIHQLQRQRRAGRVIHGQLADASAPGPANSALEARSARARCPEAVAGADWRAAAGAAGPGARSGARHRPSAPHNACARLSDSRPRYEPARACAAASKHLGRWACEACSPRPSSGLLPACCHPSIHPSLPPFIDPSSLSPARPARCRRTQSTSCARATRPARCSHRHAAEHSVSRAASCHPASTCHLPACPPARPSLRLLPLPPTHHTCQCCRCCPRRTPAVPRHPRHLTCDPVVPCQSSLCVAPPARLGSIVVAVVAGHAVASSGGVCGGRAHAARAGEAALRAWAGLPGRRAPKAWAGLRGRGGFKVARALSSLACHICLRRATMRRGVDAARWCSDPPAALPPPPRRAVARVSSGTRYLSQRVPRPALASSL